MSDDFVRRVDCADKMTTQDSHCKERCNSVGKDVDRLGESHRRLEDRLNGLDEKVDRGFLAMSQQNANMYKGLAITLLTSLLSLAGIAVTLFSMFVK